MAASRDWLGDAKAAIDWASSNGLFDSEADCKVCHDLAGAGQAHIFASWLDGDKEKVAGSIKQLVKLNKDYPAGLVKYVENARSLLNASQKGLNPYDGWKPSVPAGERIEFGTEAFAEAEALGMKNIAKAAFTLVAGGLGERLGYGGIKIELPMETVTESCYLSYYVSHILAYQARARTATGDDKLELPLCIMTSGDTHAMTVKLLEANDRFGMSESQLTIVKQEKVPALANNDASFALDSEGAVVTKPHGHGDVHTLLHTSGTAKRWVDEGREWLVFFQDTNGQVFRSVPAAIGVSASNQFHLNSMTVPRAPGEAVGGICKLTHDDGRELTINVEYNQLDPLLRSTVNKDGDVADESGRSPYPGNINVLVFHIPSYAKTLEASGGAIPEFVNPKYKDAAKTEFKKPTRLECMMQVRLWPFFATFCVSHDLKNQLHYCTVHNSTQLNFDRPAGIPKAPQR